VRAFLIQRHELVFGRPRNQDLELTLSSHHLHSAARVSKFRDTGQVYDNEAGLDPHRSRCRLR
jgi:hypothetical protein